MLAEAKSDLIRYMAENPGAVLPALHQLTPSFILPARTAIMYPNVKSGRMRDHGRTLLFQIGRS